MAAVASKGATTCRRRWHTLHGPSLFAPHPLLTIMAAGVVAMDFASDAADSGAGVVVATTDMFSRDLDASGVFRGTELIWKVLMSSDELWLSASAAVAAVRSEWPEGGRDAT